jgi:PAS domain S-box-containing protein
MGLMWELGIALLLVLVGAAVLLPLALRRMFQSGKNASGAEKSGAKPSVDNPAAFMTASMQAVIQKLRDQEKELAALQRRDRERAQQTERLSEAVTRNMPAGLLLIGSAGLVTSANPAAENALGVHALVYRRYSEVFGVDSALARLVGGCLSGGHTYRREEVEYTTPNGELRQLGVTISPILGPAKEVTGALCLLSDLTELAALQRQVQVKESLAALGELSAGIAHEFKNALATISGYAQMIRSESDGDVAENSQRILEQTRSLAHVVTEFLKFARPMDLANDDVEVSSLIQRVADEVREVVPDVEITIAGEFESLSGDEALLRQALLNLIRNAAEATKGQSFAGRVTIRGSIEQTGERSVQRISVSDNGPGVPMAELSKIFVPFYTTKAQGTGLGLAIVQKIVVQHGGEVEVRNQSEGGAEFILWLPLSRRHASAVDSLAARI